GDPTSSDTTVGPLSSALAAERLDDQVKRAVDQGATLVAGGDRDGNFFSTTVLTGITPDNDAYHEEFFGPVASVYRVGSEAEAVDLANDTPFGGVKRSGFGRELGRFGADEFVNKKLIRLGD